MYGGRQPRQKAARRRRADCVAVGGMTVEREGVLHDGGEIMDFK